MQLNLHTLKYRTLRAGPPGIPVREFPGIWHCQIPGGNSREFCDNNAIGYFFPVISLFVQFHYNLQQTLSVNDNVLSINNNGV